MPPPGAPVPPGPPSGDSGKLVLWHVLAALGSLAELATVAGLSSNRDTRWLMPLGVPVYVVLFAVFYSRLGRWAAQWSTGKRTASALFLAFGILGWLTLLAAMILVGLVFGACFCTKR